MRANDTVRSFIRIIPLLLTLLIPFYSGTSQATAVLLCPTDKTWCALPEDIVMNQPCNVPEGENGSPGGEVPNFAYKTCAGATVSLTEIAGAPSQEAAEPGPRVNRIPTGVRSLLDAHEGFCDNPDDPGCPQ